MGGEGWEGRGGEGRGGGGMGGEGWEGRGGEGREDIHKQLSTDACVPAVSSHTHSAGGGYLLCKGEYLPLVHSTKLSINTEVVLIQGLQGRAEGRTAPLSP